MNEFLKTSESVAAEYKEKAELEAMFNPSNGVTALALTLAATSARLHTLCVDIAAQHADTAALLEDAFGDTADAVDMLLSTNDED